MLVSRFPVIREGLRALLERNGGFDVVGVCGDLKELAAAALAIHAEVAVVDPDSDEVSLRAVSILAETGRCRVLVFTAAADPTVFARAIERGAAGVLVKDQPLESLYRAIQKVHAGELWLDRAKTALVLTHAMRRGRDPEQMKIESLTRREREIVALVGEGLRNAAIAERLFISEATVRNHLTSILGKLSLADRFDLAVYAFRHGLVGSPESAALRSRLHLREVEPAPKKHQAADSPRPGWVRSRPPRGPGE